MGGAGKTTITAALVRDKDIRTAFSIIVWASLGQQPDVRELQNSIHMQLTNAPIPDSAKTKAERRDALRIAAYVKSVLLVLDDMWDPKFEKELNCIDPDDDNGSRLVITTRIRKFLKSTVEVEVGVLSQGESLDMLLAYADVESLESSTQENSRAQDIVELCGRLPLTLAIAGGIVASSGGTGFSAHLHEYLKTRLSLTGWVCNESICEPSLTLSPTHHCPRPHPPKTRVDKQWKSASFDRHSR